MGGVRARVRSVVRSATPSTDSVCDARTVSGGNDIVAVGGDLEPATLLGGVRAGLFPMKVDGVLAWWSPDPRGILPLDGFHREPVAAPRDPRRFEIRIDTAFEAVMRACGDPRRPHGWIDEIVRRRVLPAARARVGAQRRDVATANELVGGFYGVRIRGLFAGESMFHRVTDASKVALWAAVELLRHGRRDAVRRAVDDTAPRVARRGRRVPCASISSCSTRR